MIRVIRWLPNISPFSCFRSKRLDRLKKNLNAYGIERVPQWSHIGRVNSIMSGRSPPLHCTLTLIIT